MFKEFIMKQMLKRQLKGVPAEEQNRIISIVTKNPELFQKIASEAQVYIKSGMDQMTAMQRVMLKYKTEIEKVMK